MRAINGDPDFVAAQAQAILDAAGQIQDATKKLYSIGYGPVRSDAVDSLKVNVRELTTVLDDARTRYEKTGHALAGYAPVLRDCQQRVNAAMAAMGHTDVHAAEVHVAEAEAHLTLVNHNPFASQHDRDEAVLALDHARGALHHQKSAASSAQTAYDSAIADLNNAAAAAAAQIELGIEMSQLYDTFGDRWNSFIDHLHDRFSHIFAVIHEWLQRISLILNIVSIIVMVIGFVTLQPEIFGFGVWLNRASAFVSMADLGVQELRFVIGDITFGELIGSAIIAGISTFAAIKLDAALFDGPIGGKFVTSAVDLVKRAGGNDVSFVRMMEGLHIEAAVVGLEVDTIGRIIDSPVGHFVDSVMGTKLDVATMFGTSHDVDQLTPDFSHINVDQIVSGNPVPISPMPACHVVVGAAA